MSLLGFGVKNLRCLTDTGILPLKPITLMVGRNSSGKSTFLRAFPLLRQSVESPRSAPILWYDPRFVDFGSFADTVNHRARERSVNFMFRGECRYPSNRYRPDFSHQKDIFDAAVELVDGPRGVTIASYSIRYKAYEVKIGFAADGSLLRFTVDGLDTNPTDGTLSLGGQALLLPSLQSPDADKLHYRAFIPSHDYLYYDEDWSNGGDAISLEAAWKDLFGTDKFHPARTHIPAASYAEALKYFRRSDNGLEERKDAALKLKNPRFRRLMALRIAALTPNLIDAMSLVATQFFSGVRYIAPFRASAARTHRIRELSVDEIDPQGTNLAMFLRSLSPGEMESLGSFTRTHLGFEVAIRSERNHVEILIKERGADRFVNLVDAGFGFAEILPLAATLWSAAARPATPGDRPATLVAIEQPELHLHPARQARLPRMLVGALDESRRAGHEVKLMVETHSDAVVNQLGMLIRAGKVAQEDVQILFFDQDPVTRETKVVVTGYERDGALQESWPFGFLVGVPDPLDDVPDAAAEE